MTKKYLIIEAYTDANIGSGALVENTVKLLQEQLGVSKDHLRIMAHYPSVFEEKYEIKSVQDIFKFPFNINRFSQVIWLIKTINWLCFAWCFPKTAIKTKRWSDYRWADTVISVGAERINDKYIKNEFFSLFTYAIVKKFNRRMILAPSTYGPFLYRFTRFAANYVFTKLDLIYCRDQKSYDTVSQFKKINLSKILNTSDVAIFQEWSTDYKQTLFDDNEKLVGISVLRWTYVANKYETPYSNYESYKKEMAVLIDSIIEQYQVSIILFPTNYPVNGCREDDVIVAKEIYALTTHKKQIRIVETLPSAFEFKSLLACCEINITTRMHACILSTSAYIPTMSINYLFKLKEYMNSIGLNQYSVDIEDFCAYESLKIFEQLWVNKLTIKSELNRIIELKKDDLKSCIRKVQ
jgi:polysaccharide pyruvyl transferase WcaK-like protein